MTMMCGFLVPCAGSGPLPDGESVKGIDQERLALLERQAPAFIILDFRCEGAC